MIIIALLVVLSMIYWISSAIVNNNDWKEFKKDWW